MRHTRAGRRGDHPGGSRELVSFNHAFQVCADTGKVEHDLECPAMLVGLVRAPTRAPGPRTAVENEVVFSKPMSRHRLSVWFRTGNKVVASVGPEIGLHVFGRGLEILR